MRPKKHETTRSSDLSRAWLNQIINLKYSAIIGAFLTGHAILVQPANAADMPVKATPIAVPQDLAINWTGFFVGGHVGYGWGEKEWNVTTGGPVAPFNVSYGIDGIFGGVQTGFNFQFDHVVLGVENQWSWTDIGGSRTKTLGLFTNTLSANVAWFTTLTAKLGYATGRWLVYGTGGAVWAREQFRAQIGEFANTTFGATVTRTGWVAGGGVGYAVDKNWSMRLEYNYMDINGSSSRSGPGSRDGVGLFVIEVPPPPPPTPRSFDSELKQNVQTIKVGVNYRFAPLWSLR